MSIAGGHNITMRNNKIYGSRKPYTNVGLYANNWYPDRGQSHSIVVENNVVNYFNNSGNLNNFWWGDNVGTIAGRNTNRHDPNLSPSILPNQIIGRARAGAPSNPGEEIPGGGNNEPEPGEKPNDENEDSEFPGLDLSNVKNHPSISIYLDRYNRICVNVNGRVNPSEVIAANTDGEIVYRRNLTRYHTVIPHRPAPGKYHIYVRNGNREHLKSLYIR